MKRRKRKYKSNSFGISLFLIFILILLMSYASFLLYSFAKNNGLLNVTPTANNKKSNNKENIEENKSKLGLLFNILSKKNNSSVNKENNIVLSSLENKSNDNNNNQIKENRIENYTNSSDSDISNNNDKKDLTQKNDTKSKENQIKENESSKNNNEKYKINSNVFILYLAALDSQYELYLAKKSEKIDYTDSPIFSVISYLVNYKPKEPYINLIPAGTKLLGAWIKNGILFLDFNKEFLNNKNGLKSIEIQIYQIVNTALQFKEVNGVRFLIEGKPRKYFSEEGFLFDITFKVKLFNPAL
ncbi:MAG: GerMN domain-containing protein [Exilispira sp.]